MLRALLLTLFACLATVACGSNHDGHASLACEGGAYDLAIDERFGDAERAEIQDAATMWSLASGGTFVIARASVVSRDVSLERCVVQVIAIEPDSPDTEWGSTKTYSTDAHGRPGAARVALSPRLIGQSRALHAAAMHELGHAVGLDHATRDDMASCMWPMISIGCAVTEPTRARLCAIWPCEGRRP